MDDSDLHAAAHISSATFKNAHNKPDLEKQFDILAFLQKHRGSGSCLAPNIIYRATGIDLVTDVNVATMLQNNAKIQTEFIPDPENPALLVPHYAYQAKYPSIRDRTSLLAQVNRVQTGVPTRDLLDSYDGVESDIQTLITAGDVIAVQNTEDKDKILFSRGDAFLVELDGLVTTTTAPDFLSSSATTTATSAAGTIITILTTNGGAAKQSPKMNANGNGSMNGFHSNKSNRHDPAVLQVDTDVDPRRQIRRGEAVQVGGQWFRVSSAVRAGASLADQPARAQAPLSVVSLTDLSQRNEVDGYIRSFTSQILPLDDALSVAARTNLEAARQARERLHKLAVHGGRSSGGGGGFGGAGSGGVAAQLIGSNAHASNPTTLAASFATSAAGHAHHQNRKRPNVAATTSPATFSSSSGELTKATLEKAAVDPALALFSHARRHGCTKDVREMYLATRSAVPAADYDLQRVLLEHKLLEPNEQMRRPRLASKGGNVDNDGKPKKRRYYERKDQRMTNTHLEGTEIGALLAQATEKQKQGKSVGDGGM